MKFTKHCSWTTLKINTSGTFEMLVLISSVPHKVCQTSKLQDVLGKMLHQHMHNYQLLYRNEHFNVHTWMWPKVLQYTCCIIMHKWKECYVSDNTTKQRQPWSLILLVLYIPHKKIMCNVIPQKKDINFYFGYRVRYVLTQKKKISLD